MVGYRRFAASASRRLSTLAAGEGDRRLVRAGIPARTLGHGAANLLSLVAMRLP
jgi:hypothetical protein